jgi:hypothetical protein
MVMKVACCGFTVRDDVPVLVEWLLSPLYAAVTIIELGELAPGVYDTEQLPDDNVHEVGLNVPP